MSHCYRDALMQMLGHFQDNKPEIALLTTFSFSPDFFERNLLPMLAGVGKDEQPTDADLNNRLKETHVLVAYDASTQPETKGGFRYGLLPVSVKNGFFHPKIILLAGTLNNGQPGAWLLVSSGNLTLSGWGRNREIVGETQVGTQQAKELIDLTGWLKAYAEKTQRTDGEGSPLELLNQLERLLPKYKAHGDANLFIQLPDSPGLAETLFAQDTGRTEEMTVVSPFWSDMDDLKTLIGKLKSQKTRLVPSINREGCYLFPEADVTSLAKDNIHFARFSKEPERYTHAKAIEAVGKDGKTRLYIGSANFTSAAFGLNGSRKNIEAMLRYTISRKTRSVFSQLKELKNPQFAEGGSETDETPPGILPFLVEAHYDWNTKEFCCCLYPYDNTLKKGEYELKFAGNTTWISTAKPEKKITIELKTAHRQCTLRHCSDDKAFRILVDQRNAREDQLGYQPRPKLDNLITQMLQLDATGNGKSVWQETVSRNRTDETGSEDGIPETSFDIFTPLQALYKLRKVIENTPSKKNLFSSEQWLDTILSALEIEHEKGLTQQIQIAIRNYVLLWELRSIAECYSDHSGNYERFLSRLEKLITSTESIVMTHLRNTESFKRFIGDKANIEKAAGTFIEWFQQEMIKQPLYPKIATK